MKHKRRTKNRILTVCLVIGAILALVGGTLAIYNSQVFQRSVVRNRDDETIRFSSDKLYRVTAGTDAQKYFYPMDEGVRTMTFQVRNYDQTRNTLFNEKNIEYTISFKVTNGTDDFVYTISYDNMTKEIANGETLTLTNSLRGGRRSEDSYSFTFAEKDYNNIELIVTVTPTDLSTTRNRILNGILTPIEYATTQGVTVKSEFTDSGRDTPDKFDAYNLSVTVSGGAGNVLITWDNRVLDVDPYFASGKTIVTIGDYTTLTVPMNSDDETGAYIIQFYSNTPTKPNWTSWSELPIHVELEENNQETN